MRRLWEYTLVTGLAFLLAGCTFIGVEGTPTQKAFLHTPTSLPKAVTQSAMSSPTLSPPTPTAVPAPTESKPGPPSGYTAPPPVPTPTVAASIPPPEWQEITLLPPEGSEQIVPADVTVHVVSMAIPKQWGYVRHPGSYFLGPSPESAAPVLVLGPVRPFADWNEATPPDMEGFTNTLVRVYKRTYGLSDVRAERIRVGGQEGVALFPSQGEVCMDLFVPLASRYDVAYKFTFMRPLCDAEGRLTETGQSILRSIQFKYR